MLAPPLGTAVILNVKFDVEKYDPFLITAKPLVVTGFKVIVIGVALELTFTLNVDVEFVLFAKSVTVPLNV
jgi:hypothetical protein